MELYPIEAAIINGRRVHSSETISVYNPYDYSTIGTVPCLRRDAVLQAISVADSAFTSWSTTSKTERAQFLESFAAALHRERDDLARILSLESGKPLKEASAEIAYSISFFTWFAKQALEPRTAGKIQLSVAQELLVQKEPIGVCAFITPWNFPLAMLAKKIAPAFAAGCTVVAKPSEETPFSGIALAKIAQDIGIPDGVLNIVTGEAQSIGEIFCSSPIISKLSFTGSTEIGRLLLKQSAPQVKRVSLELGGNAPFLVFNDADIDKTIAAIEVSKFRNGGQTCIAANRFLVQREIFPKLLPHIKNLCERLIVGNPLDAKTDIGPMINATAIQKLHRLLSDSLDKGAQLLHGSLPTLDTNHVHPILLTDLHRDMLLWKEEIFGPIIAIKTFETEEEAIQLANDSIHGLAAYAMTENQQRMERLSKALQAGLIGINTGRISHASAPFGGYKQSGLGREGGVEGIDEYLETKSIFIQ